MDQFGEPIANPVRALWVTETALTTALNTAYFAEQVGLFAIVMGAALVLTGGGFTVLTFASLLRHQEEKHGAYTSQRAAAPAGAQ
jgi:hypothetical protein